MNLLFVIVVALACCGVVVLIGAGMVLDARARRDRLAGSAEQARDRERSRPDGDASGRS